MKDESVKYRCLGGNAKKVRKQLKCGCVVERDKLGTEYVRFCNHHTPRFLKAEKVMGVTFEQ